MRKNKTKIKLHNGKPVFGVIGANSDPMLAELVGLAGFDFYMEMLAYGIFAERYPPNFP